MQLNATELERYRRQMMHDGFTSGHQARLMSSTALVAGIGGLGGTAALYLAVAGIGKMVFAHSGDLTLSNLNRQILMKHDRIGWSRVAQARRTVREINPDVEIEIVDERISSVNAGRLVRGADIVLSARPNFQERRVLNETCVRLKTPMVEAAMNAMEGYLFNIIPHETPCLDCVYPQDNPEWEELGFPVLGAVSGMLGCIMAVEAIKLLSGFGKALYSQLLVFNAAKMDFRKLNVKRDINCRVCGS